MPEINDSTHATVPAQPEATGPMRKSMPVVMIWSVSCCLSASQTYRAS